MIVQALYKRYLDQVSDPSSGISPSGYSVGKISYALVLSPQGELVNIVDIRDTSGKKPQAARMIVPEQPGRARAIKAYFLADKAEYLLAHYVLSGNDGEKRKRKKDARDKFTASKILHETILSDANDPASLAVRAFFSHWNPENVRDHPLLQDLLPDLDKGMDTNMVFRLEGQQGFVHEQEVVRRIWSAYREQPGADNYTGQCMITGEKGVSIARLHDNKIKGVRDSQSSGALLVSFNEKAYESYGKEQSYNAPVSKEAAFGYTTALNQLLASPANRIINFGGMTLVFWAEPSPMRQAMEASFAAFFGGQEMPDGEQAALTENIQDALERARSGADLTPDMLPEGDKSFYILGLSPNNSRLAVRFFRQGEFSTLLRTYARHAADYQIAGKEFGPEAEATPRIYRILMETMRVGGDGRKVGDGPPASVEGDLFRAIVNGTAYPAYLFTAVINRLRSDGIVNKLRMAMLKGHLVRYGRIHQQKRYEEVIQMILNRETRDSAYRLGRLFAVLEKAQQDAAGGPNRLNATIKDRFFSSASSTPAAVFPNLLRLSSSHTSKSKYGDYREREKAEILSTFDPAEGGFPTQLNLQEQGLFFLGYYQQKEDFYTKKEVAEMQQLEPEAIS